MSSNQERGDLWRALAQQTTQNGTLTKSGLLESGKSDEMLEARTGRPVGGQPFTQHTDKFCHRWWWGGTLYTATEWNPFVQVTVVFLQRVNDRVRKILEPFFNSCNTRHRQTFLSFGECLCLSTLEASVFISKIQKNDLASKQMFDRSGKLTVGQSDEFFLEWLQLTGKESFMETIIFGQWLKKFISLLHAKVYVLIRFCVMSWKGESEPNIQCCLGRKIELVQIFTTIQNFGTQLTESRWNSSGIFSQDSPHCSSSAKSKSSWPK